MTPERMAKLSRMIRGIAANASWRRQHAAAKKHKTFYRSAVGVVRGTALILLLPLPGAGPQA